MKCLTDNCRQFTSQNFYNLMNKYGIKHIETPPHNPTGNSIVERINREISLCLRLSRSLSLKKAAEKILTRLNLKQSPTLGRKSRTGNFLNLMMVGIKNLIKEKIK
ncbi:Gag-Pro-Pol polyprotein [Dictyocoela muelleri]|nr:Gag-Pro-Pol polyprotein [Dictyocoela muelleri]